MKPLIHCSHSKVVPIEELIENPRNPNTHPEEQLVLLAKIINSQGWRQPIVVSARSGFIVKGHGRYQAAKLAGFVECPIDMQSYDNEATEWADLIADNRIAELSVINRGGLKDLLNELDTGSIDLELTGFDNSSLQALMSEYHAGNDVNLEEFFEQTDGHVTNDDKNKIVLNYSDLDHEKVCKRLGELQGSKEDIIFNLLFP